LRVLLHHARRGALFLFVSWGVAMRMRGFGWCEWCGYLGEMGPFLHRRIRKRGYGGCWKWVGQREKGGYGRIEYRGLRTHAHRVMYAYMYGVFDPELLVCHKCDNPICVRPTHLFLGTNDENMADMVRKERQCRGENICTARLTRDDVLLIRSLNGIMSKDIAKLFDISPSEVSDIQLGKKWKHVGGLIRVSRKRRDVDA